MRRDRTAGSARAVSRARRRSRIARDWEEEEQAEDEEGRVARSSSDAEKSPKGQVLGPARELDEGGEDASKVSSSAEV